MIQVFKPSMGEQEINAVAEVLRSGWLGLGPKTAEFETQFARFCDVPYAVGVNSATSALDLAMKLLRINHGDEVIVPTMTFVSTAHVVAYNLALPIFADVDPVTLNIDTDDVVRKVTPRTKAVIVTHYGGRPVDIDALRLKINNIPVVEDCAHAAGARYKGRPVGGLGSLGCFSFHAVKNLATGDGGMITLRDEVLCERAKTLRWLGIDKGTWDRAKIDQSYWWKYQVKEIGLKCHMNDITAAIGLVQLARLSAMNLRRRQIVDTYFAGLGDVEQLQLPPRDEDSFQSSWHLFCIKCDRRDALSVYLAERGIATSVHYTPIHLYSCYGNCPHLPVAETLQDRLLTLPLYPDLTDEQVSLIIQIVRRYYSVN